VLPAVGESNPLIGTVWREFPINGAATDGRSSIKKVLQALLVKSEYLR